MNERRQADEHLERLWYMKEEGRDSLRDLKGAMGEGFDLDLVHDLSSAGLVEVSETEDKIVLTKKGEDRTRQLIRAHRLAERLLYDVLGTEFESGACEFEHIITPQIVDSICTLLAHPRECPHGMPIPEGDCCTRAARTAESSVTPLTELNPGQAARVAYVNAPSDQRLHKMDGLQIRPGILVRLHQKYPAYVVECEGGYVALDEAVAASICVWRPPVEPEPGERPAGRRGRRRTRLRGKAK